MLRTESGFRIVTAAAASALVIYVPTAPGENQTAAQSFEYHHPDVMGTQLDLTVVAGSHADADAADKAVMAEITRLRGILSAYDPSSELGRLNASPVGGPGLAVSPELIDVLKEYDAWSKKTAGAYTGHIGDLIAVWGAAEKAGQVPSDDLLQSTARKCAPPAWEIDEPAHTVRRVSDQQINVDSLGKGYVIDKAVAAATKSPGTVQGLLLNIGGDLRTWGSPVGPAGTLWSVGVQDPAHPELNAKPLTTIYVPGGTAVSSSGAYQRYYTIGGKRYSHVLDARTGKPGPNPAATVVAKDSATANALATICCVMDPADAMPLVKSTTDAQGLICTADGKSQPTDGFKSLEQAKPAVTAAVATGKTPVQFPAGFKVSIKLQTVQTQRRPYVFVWITDADGKHVKTIGAYGNDRRYWRDMREWWKLARNDNTLQSITHATQRSRDYPLVWDGTDQQGNGVPPGKYNVWVEVAAEHGPHSAKFVPIELGKETVEAKIPASNAFAEVPISYGTAETK